MQHARSRSVGGIVCQVLTIPIHIRSYRQAVKFLDSNPLLSWGGRIAVVGGNCRIRLFVIAHLGFRGNFSEILERVGGEYVVIASHDHPTGAKFPLFGRKEGQGCLLKP